MRVEEKLGDGSMMVVEDVPGSARIVLLSRIVDDEVVYGQAWSRVADEFEAWDWDGAWPGSRGQEVMASIRDMPASFDRRPLWDPTTGAAVRP